MFCISPSCGDVSSPEESNFAYNHKPMCHYCDRMYSMRANTTFAYFMYLIDNPSYFTVMPYSSAKSWQRLEHYLATYTPPPPPHSESHTEIACAIIPLDVSLGT